MSPPMVKLHWSLSGSLSFLYTSQSCPLQKDWPLSSLQEIFTLSLPLPWLTSLHSFLVFPKSTPSVRHQHQNPYLSLCFWVPDLRQQGEFMVPSFFDFCMSWFRTWTWILKKPYHSYPPVHLGLLTRGVMGKGYILSPGWTWGPWTGQTDCEQIGLEAEHSSSTALYTYLTLELPLAVGFRVNLGASHRHRRETASGACSIGLGTNWVSLQAQKVYGKFLI